MSIVDDLGKVGNVLRKADKIPEFQTILDIQQKLIDLQEENTDLKQELRELKNKDEFESKLIYEKNAYYFINDNGEKEGPYCPVCWGYDTKKIRMRDCDTSYYCDKCKAYADK
jgi:hypothetical protein